ncbi:MAG: MFS transporter [Caulobacteraceae bacterium]
MSADAAVPARPEGVGMRTIVAASSAGTAFEWYDFFVFGTLSAVIGKNFFAQLDNTAGVLAALALFGAGFFFRPIGALIFGGMGDKIGRKAAFLVTVSMMGGATCVIGLLPTYQQAGPIAPILLILCRIIQGTALGGEYGGAAIFVAEHAPADKRGAHTGWIQTSAAFGLLGALGVIYLTRQTMGEEAFTAATWTGGWRIPFLFSAGLLAISVYMRLKLVESPTFQKLKDSGQHSHNPYLESFTKWENLKIVLMVLVAILSAQGAAWYTAFFYAQVFMERFLKIAPTETNLLMMAMTIASAPLYVFFAWLSDKVGRKWVMWFGMTLYLVFYFPGFHLLTQLGNPALAEAQARTPVVVVADPATCAFQFDVTGKAAYTTACDIAKASLANAGVSYENQAAPAGSPTVIRIGTTEVASRAGTGLAPADLKAVKADVDARIKAALKAAGYPEKADPARVNFLGLFGVLLIFAVAATALYGPMASALVELFPTRIRYTALSLPYNVGTGWIGGFMPFFGTAIVIATGNIYSGLWYSVVFTGISVFACIFLLPETKGKPID